MELSASVKGRKAAAKCKQSSIGNWNQQLQEACLSALSLSHYRILSIMFNRRVKHDDCSCDVCDIRIVSRFEVSNVCLRLPPAAICLHAVSCAVVIFVVTSRTNNETDRAVSHFRTFAAKHLSSHVCCCLSPPLCFAQESEEMAR